MQINYEDSLEAKSYRDYKGNRTCKKYRDIGEGLELTKETGIAYQRKVAHAEIIKGVADGTFKLDEVEDLIDQGIASSYALSATNEARKKIEAAQLRRYLLCEDLKTLIFDNAVMPIDCENGVLITDFRPDALRINEKNRSVEAIWYRSGSPDINERTGMTPDNHDKMQQWFNCWLLKQYAKKTAEQTFRLKDGDKYFVTGSHYFMKKTTDKDGQIFDYDFFSDKGGNVVSLTSEYAYGRETELSDEDKLIHKFMEECSEGVENCTGLCSGCDLKSQCSYTKAPVKAEKKKIVKNSGKKEFNREQEEVISHRKGACVVNARPGSGKTACVVERTCRLIEEGVDPCKILHLSFTDNAVNELRQRLRGALLSRGIVLEEEPKCCTNNGFANEAIQEFYKELGYNKPPMILQPDEEMQVIEDLCNEHPITGINAGSIRFNRTNCTPVMLIVCQAAFEAIRSKGIDVEAPDAEDAIRNALSEKGLANYCEPTALSELCDLYRKNAEVMKQRCLVTYAEQEPLMFRVLKMHPEYFEELGFEHIIMDEFQDSNTIQAETLKSLISTKAYESLLMVGDVSQSIYRFRGTSSKIMLSIEEILGVDVKKIDITTNYRSTGAICELANAIEKLNDDDMQPMVNVKQEGIQVSVKGFYKHREAEHENYWIIEQVKKKVFAEGIDPKDICLMAYKRADLIPLGTALTKAGIPWVSKNPMDLMENSKVLGALALSDAFYEPEVTIHYFNYLVAKYDGDMFRIRTNEEIMDEVGELKDLFCKMEYYDMPFDKQRVIFHSLLEDIRSTEEDEIFEYFLELLYQKKDLPSELYYTRTFKKYGNSLSKKMEQDYEGVTLVTAHSAKGMEWPVVYLSLSSFDNEALHKKTNREEVEERRRVMYVAITRAMDELYITGEYVAYGKKDDYTYNQFLKDVFVSLGRMNKYVPIDPMEAAREEKRKEERRRKDKERRASKKAVDAINMLQMAGKWNTMTPEEIEEYEKTYKGATQMTFDDLIMPKAS